MPHCSPQRGSALATAPAATATDGDYAINGTFSVVSNGEWAKMNDRYQDEPTVRSTWTVNSTCSTAITCAGKVTSSLGWTEDIYTTSGLWYVKHYVPDWIPCPDGQPRARASRSTASSTRTRTARPSRGPIC